MLGSVLGHMKDRAWKVNKEFKIITIFAFCMSIVLFIEAILRD